MSYLFSRIGLGIALGFSGLSHKKAVPVVGGTHPTFFILGF